MDYEIVNLEEKKIVGVSTATSNKDSEMGEKIDLMLYITIGVTGVVFFITQILLFWFSFKYQERDDRKAYYFPHNTKLELLWTTVPAIFLTVLVVFGLKLGLFHWL